MNLRKIIVVGATSAIAQQCLRRWLVQPAQVVLVGRHEERLAAVARDLAVRSPASRVETATLDFSDPRQIQEWVAAQPGPIDLALVAHGSLPAQQDCQQDLAVAAAALGLNGVSPALFAEALATAMQSGRRGTLVLLGSVAGDRGRKSNYTYGAAKGLLERYAEGLQHRLAGSGVQVCLVKPGPTRTPMTAHLLDSGLPLAEVSEVADVIVRGVDKGRSVIYAPGKWALIMLVIRHLPRLVFNRLDI
jgi:short-subunit dehydrogenase